jgi:MFS family permease
VTTGLGKWLALDRNTGSVAGAMLLMALGEELWKRFVPKYLEALGAPLAAIGAYGSMRDLLDGVLQYPGGWVADFYGRRTGLRIFLCLAISGYGLMLLGRSWQVAFLGLGLAMAWSSMASPTLFAVIGDALPPERRAMGFSVQAILRRIPIAVAPILGGLLIAGYGARDGTHLGLIVTLVLALATLGLVSFIQLPVLRSATASSLTAVWRNLPDPLRRLLLSDILVRTCEGLVDVFLVIYALDIIGIAAPAYGALVAIQMTTSIIGYLPAARLADRIGRKPLVVATFLAFAAFPLAVVASHSFEALIVAFVIAGLREIGEPARKAMIVDLAPPGLRARAIGMYYLVRSVSIAPAALAGGFLWRIEPAIPFLVAGGFGLLGAGTFALTVVNDLSPKPAADPGRTG